MVPVSSSSSSSTVPLELQVHQTGLLLLCWTVLLLWFLLLGTSLVLETDLFPVCLL